MHPNFEKMTTAELKAYALAHRDEIEPLREIYRRRTPDAEAVWYRLPENQEDEEQLQQFQQILSEMSS
jgi:hypothetical protein